MESYVDILNGTPKVIFNKIMKHITNKRTYIQLTLYKRFSSESTSYKAIWFYGPWISTNYSNNGSALGPTLSQVKPAQISAPNVFKVLLGSYP